MQMLPTKPPLDPYPYEQHPESRPFSPDIEPGTYVFVQDAEGTVWVAPDGAQMHPRVLGYSKPAACAGELIVEAGGIITEVNNLSGTFQFGPETLERVVESLRKQGATVPPGAVTGFDVRW